MSFFDLVCVAPHAEASVAYGGSCSASAQCEDNAYEPRGFDQRAVRCLGSVCSCSVVETVVTGPTATYCEWGDWRGRQSVANETSSG